MDFCRRLVCSVLLLLIQHIVYVGLTIESKVREKSIRRILSPAEIKTVKTLIIIMHDRPIRGGGDYGKQCSLSIRFMRVVYSCECTQKEDEKDIINRCLCTFSIGCLLLISILFPEFFLSKIDVFKCGLFCLSFSFGTFLPMATKCQNELINYNFLFLFLFVIIQPKTRSNRAHHRTQTKAYLKVSFSLAMCRKTYGLY